VSRKSRRTGNPGDVKFFQPASRTPENKDGTDISKQMPDKRGRVSVVGFSVLNLTRAGKSRFST
jgi:hypothetical protein